MYKKLELRMVIAGIIIIGFFFIRQMATTVLLSDYEDMSATINMAGRQRMFSQRISKDVAMLRGDVVINRRDHYVVELSRTLQELQNEYEKLSKQDNSEVIVGMYEELEPIMEIFVTATQDIIMFVSSNEEANIEKQTDARVIVLTYEDDVLNQMDAIVSQYEWEAKQSINWIKRIENIFFILQMLMIILVTFFIFVPAHKTFKSMYLEAAENNTNMIRLFHIMRNVLFLLDHTGSIKIYNKKAKHLLEKLGLDASISHANEIFEDASESWIDIQEKLANGDENNILEVTFNKKEQVVMEVSLTNGVYQGENTLLLNLYDVTSQKKVEEALTSLVIKDKLTGLYNRYHLENIIDSEIEQSERYDIPLSMIILDLDHFKNINDRWGHPVGDQVLKQTADILLENIRKADSVFRIGGEEFVVFLSHTNINGAKQVAEKVRFEIEKSIHPIVGKYTASFGVAERKAGETYRNLYQRVDQALYLAKNSGRNCVKESEGDETTTSVALRWKDSWNSGNKFIDDQHRTLFRLANELLNMSYEGSYKEEFISKLDTIILHIEKHFAYEEKVLEKIHYQERFKHHKIHENLINRGKHLRTLVEKEEITLQILVHYIFDDVIIGHLLREDVLYFPYIN